MQSWSLRHKFYSDIHQYDPVLTPGNEKVVHHIVLYRCRGEEPKYAHMDYDCYAITKEYRPECRSVFLMYEIGAGVCNRFIMKQFLFQNLLKSISLGNNRLRTREISTRLFKKLDLQALVKSREGCWVPNICYVFKIQILSSSFLIALFSPSSGRRAPGYPLERTGIRRFLSWRHIILTLMSGTVNNSSFYYFNES